MQRTLLFLLLPLFAHAATTIDVTNGNAYGANIGWVNGRGDVTNGAATGEFICSGFIYSANCGWINLGNGTPANGIRYQNNSATDFGVNTQNYSSNGVTFEAKLRGFAYGANIGWVNFEATGDPRINLATGQLLGFAYGANVGWIALSGTGVNVSTTVINRGVDTDGDGIADAWERTYAGNLTTMNTTTDTDDDGTIDFAEYAADTSPINPNDRPFITALVPTRQLVVSGPFVTDVTFTSKPTRWYEVQAAADLAGLWLTVEDNILPSGSATTFKSFSDPLLITQPSRRFFRVVSKLPLAP